MSQSSDDIQAIETSTLLTCYGFDMRGFTPLGLMNDWLKTYPLQWIRWAVVEALYQGRYKAISVEQLLNFWLRRGQPSFHFNSEFERLISNNLPKNYSANTLLDHPDEARSLLVPPTIMLPSFPPPPSLLEPILNKPLIQLPETLDEDPWDSNDENENDDENEVLDPKKDVLSSELLSESALVKNDENLEPLPPQIDLQEMEPDSLTPEMISETEPYSSSRSIHRFIPVLDKSDLFGKLRTVVHRELTDSLT